MLDVEGAKLPLKVATKYKKSEYPIINSETALHEPFRMQE